MCFMGSSKYKTPNATFPRWCQVILICWECSRVGVVQSCGQKVRHQVLEDSKETNKIGEKMQHILKKPETFNFFSKKTSKWMIANFGKNRECHGFHMLLTDHTTRLIFTTSLWFLVTKKNVLWLFQNHVIWGRNTVRLSLKWVGLRGKHPWTQLEFPGDLDEPTEFTRRRAFNFSWSFLDLGWVFIGGYPVL